MSEDLPSAAPILPEPTEARFSMRALFITMTVLAIIAAVVSPLVRRLSLAQQVRLMAAWGIWFAVAILWIGYEGWQRRRAEALAGRTLLRLPMYDERVPRLSRTRRNVNIVGAAFLGLLWLFSFCTIVLTSFATPGSVGVITYAMLGLFGISIVSHSVGILCWRNNIRFGASGILWDKRVISWSQLIAHRWSERTPDILELEGIDQHNTDFRLKVHVPFGQHDQLEQLIRSQTTIAKSGSVAHDFVSLDFDQKSHVRHAGFARYLGVSLWFALAILYFWWIQPQLGFASRAFGQGAFCALLAPAFTLNAYRLRSKSAGAFYARLPREISWKSAAASLTIVAAICFSASSLSLLDNWQVRCIGFVGVSTAMYAMTSLQTRTFDLREQGLMIQHGQFWPWSQMKLLAWDRADTGRLVLSRGRRRVSAKVPPEQRDAVDAVLKEKLGEKTRTKS